jgi:UDPglucose--hexose-1-phosphate uridylyltransferase
MNTAIKSIASEALKQRVISKIPISPFFNIGRTVGGSQRRIHAQVYMDLNQDGHGARIDGILKSFENMRKRGECRMCNSSHEEGQRIVIDEEDWIVFASGSPIRNYHLRFAPKKHIENIYDLDAHSLLSLSKILKVLFLALNDLGIDRNRNIVFNTKPHGYESSFFHIFGDIYPFEFVGGAEMADDMRVVRISPKTFAKDLREAIKKNGYN